MHLSRSTCVWVVAMATCRVKQKRFLKYFQYELSQLHLYTRKRKQILKGLYCFSFQNRMNKFVSDLQNEEVIRGSCLVHF